MLIGIDPRATPDLVYCLAAMGHGDEIAIVDSNFPKHAIAADTVFGEPIYLPGFSAPAAIDMISGLMPLDAFAAHCALRMEIDDAPGELGAVHSEAFDILQRMKPEAANLGSIERQAFYSRARACFAIVHTTESRPYGCFILRKGVIF